MQQQIVLFIRSLCSLPTTVCVAADSVVYQVAVLPSYNSKAIVSLQIVRQVAVLPFYNSKATVSLQIVRQIALLPSFTGNLHCCKLGRSAPFLQQ